jgi:histidinol phosphatase-like PHP family hydrolase
MAEKYGVKLVINNDAHAPSDILSPELIHKIALGCGLSEEQYQQAPQHSADIVARIKG